MRGGLRANRDPATPRVNAVGQIRSVVGVIFDKSVEDIPGRLEEIVLRYIITREVRRHGHLRRF